MFWVTGDLIVDKGKENPQQGHKWASHDDRYAPGVMGNQCRSERRMRAPRRQIQENILYD